MTLVTAGVTLVMTMIMGIRGDTGGHHEIHHHHDLQAAEDQPVLYYANPEDPSQVYSQQGNKIKKKFNYPSEL